MLCEVKAQCSTETPRKKEGFMHYHYTNSNLICTDYK